jgi:O-antigen/teichoic acid export membrane protein
VVAAVAGLMVTWLAARGLGDPAQVGMFFAATAAFGLAAGVAKLGTATSLVYWPARLRALGAGADLARCLRVALVPVGAASVAIAAALAVGGLWDRTAVGRLLAVLAVLLPMAALTDALLAATRGYRAMRPTVLLDRLLRPALQLLALGALVLLAVRSTAGFALAWAAPYAPVAVLCGFALSRVHRAQRGASGGGVFRARDYWAFTAPRAVASVAQLALQRVDVLLVAVLGGLPAAALYAVAARFILCGQLVNSAISQVIQPRLAECLAVGDIAGARTLYRQATAWLVLATWPLYLLVATNATVYLGLFGAGYRHGAPVVWVLAGAMLVATSCGMVDMVLAMGGRTRWNLCNVGLALVTMIGVDRWLIPAHGAVGAAVGLAAAVLVNNLVPLAQIGWTLRLHPFGRNTVTAGALAVGCFGAPPVLVRAAGGGPVALGATTIGALACYLAGVLVLRVHKGAI